MQFLNAIWAYFLLWGLYNVLLADCLIFYPLKNVNFLIFSDHRSSKEERDDLGFFLSLRDLNKRWSNRRSESTCGVRARPGWCWWRSPDWLWPGMESKFGCRRAVYKNKCVFSLDNLVWIKIPCVKTLWWDLGAPEGHIKTPLRTIEQHKMN